MRLKDKAINFFKKALIIIFSIASIISLFIFLRWAGIKGIISLFLGMGIMAYLFMSKNFMLSYIIESTKSEDYIEEIKKKKD